MTKEQKAHVESILIQRIDELAKHERPEEDEMIARLTRELTGIHSAVCEESERVIKPSIQSCDGLTSEETISMLADVVIAKEKKGYTPVYVGASGAVYVGGVKLEGVIAIQGLSERGLHTVHIDFDTNKVTNHYQPKRKEDGWLV